MPSVAVVITAMTLYHTSCRNGYLSNVERIEPVNMKCPDTLLCVLLAD
jgi:hypothetical protein